MIEATPISNATVHVTSGVTTVVFLKKGTGAGNSLLGLWRKSGQKIFPLYPPGTNDAADLTVNVWLENGQYIEAAFQVEDTDALTEAEVSVQEPVAFSTIHFDVLGFQVKEKESESEPEPEQEEEHVQPPSPPARAAATSYGHFVYGRVTNAVHVYENKELMHFVRYTCPYSKEQKTIRLYCLFLPMSGVWHAHNGVTYEHMPLLSLWVSRGGASVKLLDTAVDLISHVIFLSTDKFPTVESIAGSDGRLSTGARLAVQRYWNWTVKQVKDVWYMSEVTINSDGEFTMQVKSDMVPSTPAVTIYGKRAWSNGRREEDAIYFAKQMKTCPIRMSLFDNKGMQSIEMPTYRVYLFRDQASFDANAAAAAV